MGPRCATGSGIRQRALENARAALQCMTRRLCRRHRETTTHTRNCPASIQFHAGAMLQRIEPQSFTAFGSHFLGIYSLTIPCSNDIVNRR